MSAPPTPETSPLLALSAARLVLPDGSRLPELSAEAHGRCVALIGAWSPFFRLLTGEASLAGGQATILGSKASAAVRSGLVGLLLCDPPLPRSWTAGRYLIESGRLLGWRKPRAIQRARELLERFQLTHLTARPLGSLPFVERRALLVAHATLGDPRVVCAEAPLDRLEGDAAAYVGARLELALEHRSAILHFPSPAVLGPERALIDRADRVLVFALGQVQDHHKSPSVPAQGGPMLITVTRHAAAFSVELADRGLMASPVGHLAALLPALATPEGAELARFLVQLPDLFDTKRVLEASRSAGAPLVEMRPLERWG